jgi:Lysine exporter LysO
VINIVVLIVPLVAGVLFGYFLREKKHVDLSRVTFGVILVLIFSLGFSIGSNGELLGSLPRVGVASLVLMLLAVAFSVVFVLVALKVVRFE